MPSADREHVCADCTISTHNVMEVRKRYLCHPCFIKYVLSKIVKRMEAYRSQNQVGRYTRKALLPISGGTSSLVLLHALDLQVKKQVEQRRDPAHELILVHADLDGLGEHVETWRQTITTRFPDHHFLPTLQLPAIFQYDETIESDLRSLGLVRALGEDDTMLLSRLFSSTKTATARSDLGDLLLSRLFVAVARSVKCETVLWGHSDSRLAAKALADVAKGRGGAVSSSINDGPSPWNIDFNHPMRELHKAELGQFIRLQQDDLASCILDDEAHTLAPAATRNTAIDALLMGYINSQEEKYPHIMANVVRTSAKLQTPSVGTAPKCRICAMPAGTIAETNDLCYGCNRMKQDVKLEIHNINTT